MDRNSSTNPKRYVITPITKTEYLQKLVRSIVDGLGDQEFTESHIIKFIKADMEETDCPFDKISSSLLYRIVSREIDKLYEDRVLERFVGGPPWVYINAEAYHEKD